MLTPANIAARVQKTWRPMTQALIYRVTSLFSPKAASAAAIGATTISLNTLPAGLDRVLPGDTFGSGLYRFTAEVVAAGGVISAAPFTPALSAGISSGAVVQVSRTVDTECRGFYQWLDTSQAMASPMVKSMDAVALVLCDSLPFTPRVGDKIVANGRSKGIVNIGKDAAGAAWTIQVTG